MVNDSNQKKKKFTNEGAQLPLMDRLGLSKGSTERAPAMTQMVQGAPMGSLVDSAMARRRQAMESGVTEDETAKNRVARQSPGKTKQEIFNASTT